MSLTGRTEQQLQGSTQVDTYYPVLTHADIVNDYRVPVEFEQALIAQEIDVANITVNDMLRTFKAKYSDFDAALGDLVDGIDATTTDLYIMYRRAVFALARGYIGKHYLTLGSRQANDAHADVDEVQYQHWMDMHTDAVDYIIRNYVDGKDDNTAVGIGGYSVQTI